MPVSALPAMRAAIAYNAPAAASSDWWLSGGISASNVIAVYQPKGAASLAASYINLANSGTYDAAVGSAPGFNTATGWDFSGGNYYLTTGIIPADDQSWTFIVRFSDASTSGGWLFGGAGSNAIGILPVNSASRTYVHGTGTNVAGTVASGVMAMAGNTAYLNGVSDGSISAGTGSPIEMYIGCRLNTNDSRSNYTDAKIQALAIYNTTLTSDQVAAVSTAMAAL